MTARTNLLLISICVSLFVSLKSQINSNCIRIKHRIAVTIPVRTGGGTEIRITGKDYFRVEIAGHPEHGRPGIEVFARHIQVQSLQSQFGAEALIKRVVKLEVLQADIRCILQVAIVRYGHAAVGIEREVSAVSGPIGIHILIFLGPYVITRMHLQHVSVRPVILPPEEGRLLCRIPVTLSYTLDECRQPDTVPGEVQVHSELIPRCRIPDDGT